MNFSKNSRKGNLIIFLAFCLIFIGIAIYFSKKSEINKIASTPQPSSAPEFAKVIRIYDGDTIEIEGGRKVRYIGVDSSEVYPIAQCYSAEALVRNKELVSGKTVRLEKDVSETDKYGRLLRYVYVDSVFVNDELVKEGFAKATAYPPDIKYKAEFSESEKTAMTSKIGLWGKCF